MDIIRLLQALAFASARHRNQRRKDGEGSPYVNHLIAVATVLAVEGRVTDEELIVAAVLHDTVEDTDTTVGELAERFGTGVAALVGELTDDKTLAKHERKRLQVERAPEASRGAKQLRIADKICNVRDVSMSPPAGWSLDRRREYLAWAAAVVAGCRGINASLDAAFDVTLADAIERLASHS